MSRAASLRQVRDDEIHEVVSEGSPDRIRRSKVKEENEIGSLRTQDTIEDDDEVEKGMKGKADKHIFVFFIQHDNQHASQLRGRRGSFRQENSYEKTQERYFCVHAIPIVSNFKGKEEVELQKESQIR